MKKVIVSKAVKSIIQKFDWGKLNWYANQKIGNTKKITFGKCTIKPGLENPSHLHPNCEEILHVLEGRIIHYAGDTSFKMKKGDTITISSNLFHRAQNIGRRDAVLMIAFSSADRQTKGE